MSGTKSPEGQWDQKFFAQISITGEGRRSIQDMMLVLARVFLRVVFSNGEFSKILLRYRPDSSALCVMMPKDLSLNIILMGEYNLESSFSREILSPESDAIDDLIEEDCLQVEYLLSLKGSRNKS